MANLQFTLNKMLTIYNSDPKRAVRSQEFIQTLHQYLEDDLDKRLSDKARSRGIKVVREATLYGSFKAKDEDLAVIDPLNGPLITVGVRSQMSSVGKNALTYYQDIIGECISLQERYPMAAMGYVYLHPLQEMLSDGRQVDYERWAQLYSGIATRDDRLYRYQHGSYDQFAYMVVDFNCSDPKLCDSLVKQAVPDIDLSVETLAERLVRTFKARNVWLKDLFI